MVDLGCQRHGTDYSIEPLAKRFAPKVLLGFDPASTPACYDLEGTEIVIAASAAWVHDGTMELSGVDDEATIMVDSDARNATERTVPCFDFSAWLGRLKSPQVVVKMDIEGAELPVLEKIVADGTDDRISLLVLEWHNQFFDEDYRSRRSKVEEALRCPVEVWH